MNASVRDKFYNCAFVAFFALTMNDNFIGVQKVHGETFVNGEPEEGHGLSHKETSWILVNKTYTGIAAKGKFQILADPFEPSRSIIRRVKGVGEEWIQDNDAQGYSFHAFLRKGFCYVETLVSKPNGNPAKEEASIDMNSSSTTSSDPDPDSVSRYDSLEFGPVSLGLMGGRPICVLYPLSRFGKIKTVPVSSKVQQEDPPQTNPMRGV